MSAAGSASMEKMLRNKVIDSTKSDVQGAQDHEESQQNLMTQSELFKSYAD